MVHISEIEARLSQMGVRLSRWYKAEKKELQHILMDHEKIVCAVPGRYYGSFALLVATDQRVLMIDKRTFFMNIEDIRYDMISETNFNSGIIEATLQIYTLNKHHNFTTVKYKSQLRHLCRYVQQRVMEIRQYHGSMSPEMSLMQINPGERRPQPQPQASTSRRVAYNRHEDSVQPLPQPLAQPTAAPTFSYATPTHAQSRTVGSAALTAANRLRRHPFGSGHISMHTSVFGGSNNLFQED